MRVSSRRRLAEVALAIALVAAAVAIAAAGCQDAGCSCTPSSDTTTMMSCRGTLSGASTAQLPAVTSADVTAALFTKYNLGALANGSFSGSGQQPLRQIVTLSLDNNGIASIERYSLSGLVGLVSLSVASNNVQQLPARVFDGLAQLRQLDLHNNQLDALAGDTFVGLVQLRQLDLSGNALRSLPSAAFAPLQSLERLDLSFNFIESLAGDFLSGLASLTWLSLSSNRLTSLTAADGGGGSLFAVASRLQALDVSRNRLAQLPAANGWLANLTSLVALNLSGSFAPCDCGNALTLRTWLDTTATAAPIKSDWVAIPARSGTCSAPPPLAGTYFVNVPAVSLACVVTTSAATATTSSTAANTTATAAPAPASFSVSGAVTTGTQAAVSRDATATTSGSVLLGGSTLAIVLGCSIGAAVLLVIILVTWAVRRRLKRGLQQQQQQSPPTSSKTATARPKTDSVSAAEIAAAIWKSDGLRQDGGGWRNGAYTSSPSTDSPNGGDSGGRQSGQSAQTMQPPPQLPTPARAAAALSSSEATNAGEPAQGYYDRVAADLKEGSTTGEPRSPVRMNGLLPFAYTRQNSARSTALNQARARTMLQLGSSSVSVSRTADDIDGASASSASATLRFYSSHGALSPTTSSSNGGGDVGLFSAAAVDRSRLRRSLPRSLAVRSEPLGRNSALTSSLRHGATAGAGRELVRSLSGAAFDDAGPLDADATSATVAQHSQSTPHQPVFGSPTSCSSNFYENVGPQLVVATPPVLPHQAAAAALQPPGTPRTPNWLDGASTQFSFSPQQHSPEMRRFAPAPPPADYSTMGSSRSLSAASGSLHSGHGGGRLANDLKRFVNDTPV